MDSRLLLVPYRVAAGLGTDKRAADAEQQMAANGRTMGDDVDKMPLLSVAPKQDIQVAEADYDRSSSELIAIGG